MEPVIARGSHHVAQADFQLEFFLSRPHECRDYRHMSLYLGRAGRGEL